MDREKRSIKTPRRFENYEAPTTNPSRILKVKLKSRASTGSASDVKETPKAETIKLIKRTSLGSSNEIKESHKTPIAKPAPVTKTPIQSTNLKSPNPPKSLPSKQSKPSPIPPSATPAKASCTTPKPPIKTERYVGKSRFRHPSVQPVFDDVIPNTVLPFWDARTAAEIHEDDNVKELVHCKCGIDQESGLMVQCETCLTWQHALCLGINETEDEVPEGYTCEACANPKDVRESMRYIHDQEWLTKGKLKCFVSNANTYSQEDTIRLKKTNELIERVMLLKKLIHSYMLKTKILDADDFAKLKHFRQSWSDFNQPLNASDSRLGEENKDTIELCRTNLQAHLNDLEEYITKVLSQIEEEVDGLEKGRSFGKKVPSLESLKSDLLCMKGIVDQNLR